MSHIAIYVRQSLDRTGNAAAVDRQEQACRQLAAAKDWKDLHLYRDNDRSASSGKTRPQFEELLKGIESGTVEAVVVWHLDRLTRSVRDLHRVIDVGKPRGLNIACVHGVSLDMSDPTGVAVATILTAIAQMEVAHKGERQKASNRQRASQGKPHWSARPFGYDRDGDTVTVVQSEAEALRESARRILSGEPVRGVVRDLTGRGFTATTGSPLTSRTLTRTLLNPTAIGHRAYNGEVIAKDAWPAILDADTQAQLEQHLANPGRKKAPDDLDAVHFLSGLMVCGKCGKKMYAGAHVTRGEKRMVYKCHGGYCLTRQLPLVDEYVNAVIVARLSRPDAAQLLTEDNDVSAERAEAAQVRRRRDALAGLLADGLLSPAAVREQAGKLSLELSRLEGIINSAQQVSPVAEVLGAADVAATWEALPLKNRRQIVRALVDLTVLPTTRGRGFHPEHIKIDWKQA
ncbi:recombinase family protein [Arthrobacter rhombi]|uniref:recombinase family protein n=1 Tax=Arthrobacter rhombi TaxID=71253 RepID=UPI003FD0C93C